jgi:hypothetical protein
MPEASVLEANGMAEPGTGFAAQIQSLDALALFVRALPGWCRDNGRHVSFIIRATEEGVQVDMGFTEGATPEDAESVVARLQDCERLVRLQLLVDEMRNVGVAPQILDPMIDEATRLAERLFPRTDDTA